MSHLAFEDFKRILERFFYDFKKILEEYLYLSIVDLPAFFIANSPLKDKVWFDEPRLRKFFDDNRENEKPSLDALDQTETLKDLNIPGFNFHGLRGTPKRYSIHVNGPWSLTFEWKEGEALRVCRFRGHLWTVP